MLFINSKPITKFLDCYAMTVKLALVWFEGVIQNSIFMSYMRAQFTNGTSTYGNFKAQRQMDEISFNIDQCMTSL